MLRPGPAARRSGDPGATRRRPGPPPQQQMGPWQELRQPGVVSGAVKDGFKSWAKGKLLGYGVMALVVVLAGGAFTVTSFLKGGGGGSTSSTSHAQTSGSTTQYDAETTAPPPPASSDELVVPVPDGRSETDGSGDRLIHGESLATFVIEAEPAGPDTSMEDACVRQSRSPGGSDDEQTEAPNSVSDQAGVEAITCASASKSITVPGATDHVDVLVLHRDGEPEYIVMRLSVPRNDDPERSSAAERARTDGLAVMYQVAQQRGIELQQR